MDLRNIYEIANGDFDSTLQRIPSETLLLKLVKMFVDDPGKTALDKAVEENDAVEAFKAVHTLKGVSLNLGFDSLSVPCHALTENLRPGTFGEGWEDNYKKLCVEYDKLVAAIKEL